MDNKTQKSKKIIKIDEKMQKNNKKTPFFMQKPENIENEQEDYVKLSEIQKTKFTLSYVINLLKKNLITVDDALNLLINLFKH